MKPLNDLNKSVETRETGGKFVAASTIKVKPNQQFGMQGSSGKKVSACSSTCNDFSAVFKAEQTETYSGLKFSSFGTSSSFERKQTAKPDKPQHEQPCTLLPEAQLRGTYLAVSAEFHL